VAQDAAATARAVAQATSAQAALAAQSTAIAVKGTVEAKAAEETRAAQGTAMVVAARATAGAQATQAAATAAAQATQAQGTAAAQATRDLSTATAVAAAQTAIACQDPALYKVVLVSAKPRLEPTPPVMQVVGSLPRDLWATWTISNTGQCALQRVQLMSTTKGELVKDKPDLWQAGKEVTKTGIEPGQRAEIRLRFSAENPPGGRREWTIFVNDSLLLEDAPHLVLDVKQWVVWVTPTPTPTKTPTPTPACRVEEYPCNCHTDPITNQRICDTCTRTICETAKPT
jgi:hypothetical protein